MKRVISRCVPCKKIEDRMFTQPPIASLPEFRVRPAPPFSKVGVDFAGPLFVKKKVHKEKELLRFVYLLRDATCSPRAGRGFMGGNV